MKRHTKQDYKTEINKLFTIFKNNNKIAEYCDIKSKHLNGRHYIPQSIKLNILENLYEDMVNYISDNKLLR